MRLNFCLIGMVLLILGTSCQNQPPKKSSELANRIKNDTYFPYVKSKALEVMKAGFNAGDGYREVWIRDYNTFIHLAAQVNDRAILKENLLVFFRMQGESGI